MWANSKVLEVQQVVSTSSRGPAASRSEGDAPHHPVATPKPRTPPTRNRQALRKLYWATCTACLVVTIYYVYQYHSEQEWLRAKAADIVRAAAAATPAQEINALRDYVRQNVRYEGVDESDRPYFRATARETLESGRGYCGEATRAFICLARSRGIQAQRINLYGRINHVVAEVQTEPDREVLVDTQDNPRTNPILDAQEWTVHQIDNDPRSPFGDYSNVHLRRLPLVGGYVRYIKLRQTSLTWMLENPPLLKAVVFGGIALGMMILFTLDRALVRLYAWRFGIQARPAAAEGTR
jgi:transglutaminase-like putative cysteine protease